MEILIIGGILVIIMAAVSTIIKKSAATAYEAEIIEKEEFSLEKPDGFLYPLRDKSEFLFEAYSKDYGHKHTRNIWRARTRLRTYKGLNLHKLRSTIENGAETIVSEKTFDGITKNQKGIIIKTTKTKDDVNYKVFRKIIESINRNKTYELRTTILETYGKEYMERICKMMKSFVVN